MSRQSHWLFIFNFLISHPSNGSIQGKKMHFEALKPSCLDRECTMLSNQVYVTQTKRSPREYWSHPGEMDTNKNHENVCLCLLCRGELSQRGGGLKFWHFPTDCPALANSLTPSLRSDHWRTYSGGAGLPPPPDQFVCVHLPWVYDMGTPLGFHSLHSQMTASYTPHPSSSPFSDKTEFTWAFHSLKLPFNPYSESATLPLRLFIWAHCPSLNELWKY